MTEKKNSRCPHCGRAYPTVYARILKAFDSKQPIAQYHLGKELGVSYRQVLRVLHQLRDAKIIEIDHFEPSSKEGKEKIFWRNKQT